MFRLGGGGRRVRLRVRRRVQNCRQRLQAEVRIMRVRIQPIGNVVAAAVDVAERRAVERRPAALAPPALPGVQRGSDVRRSASVSPATTTTRSWCLIARVTAGRGETRPRPAGGRVHTTASSAAVWRGRTCCPRPPAARRRSTSNTGVPASSVEESTVLCPGLAAARASRRPTSPYGPWCDEWSRPLLFPPAPSGDEVAQGRYGPCASAARSGRRFTGARGARPRARSWRWPASMRGARGGRRVGSGARP